MIKKYARYARNASIGWIIISFVFGAFLTEGHISIVFAGLAIWGVWKYSRIVTGLLAFISLCVSTALPAAIPSTVLFAVTFVLYCLAQEDDLRAI